MKMTLSNPHYAPAAEYVGKDKAGAIMAWLQANADKEAPTFDEVRKAVGCDEKQLPDGSIAQICQDNDIACGAVVEAAVAVAVAVK